MTFDGSSRMKDLDVCEVADGPSRVDEAPAQLNLLVAVEEVGEVPADIFVRFPSNNACAAEKERNLATPIRIASTKPWDVAPRCRTILIHQSQRNSSQPRIGVERLADTIDVAKELGIVVKEADKLAGCSPQSDIPSGRHTNVFRQSQRRPKRNIGGMIFSIEHDENVIRQQ
jgi:hypothetical protein